MKSIFPVRQAIQFNYISRMEICDFNKDTSLLQKGNLLLHKKDYLVSKRAPISNNRRHVPVHRAGEKFRILRS